MKALCWHGKNDVRYETVPDPRIEHQSPGPRLPASSPRHVDAGGFAKGSDYPD